MSLLSRYIEKQVKKHGLKAFVLKILSMAAKLTPSKKDDLLVKELKKVVDQF
jgi:hypothetical protein|tara:strand:+ start:233 stop:388 length:156 start_codon:yes stop_codon:yes gene_type:complete